MKAELPAGDPPERPPPAARQRLSLASQRGGPRFGAALGVRDRCFAQIDSCSPAPHGTWVTGSPFRWLALSRRRTRGCRPQRTEPGAPAESGSSSRWGLAVSGDGSRGATGGSRGRMTPLGGAAAACWGRRGLALAGRRTRYKRRTARARVLSGRWRPLRVVRVAWFPDTRAPGAGTAGPGPGGGRVRTLLSARRPPSRVETRRKWPPASGHALFLL